MRRITQLAVAALFTFNFGLFTVQAQSPKKAAVKSMDKSSVQMVTKTVEVPVEDIALSVADQEWLRQYGGESKEKGKSIALDFVGNVYSTGSFSKEAEFINPPPIGPPGKLTAVGAKDGFVTKHNSSGILDWIVQLSASSFLNCNVITAAKMNEVYVAGTFKGNFKYTVNGKEKTLSSRGVDSDTFILKLSSDGKIIWVKQFGGKDADVIPDGIVFGSDGSLFITGHFSGKVNFYTEKHPEELTSKGMEMPTSDVFVAKLNYAGDFFWVKQIASDFGAYVSSIAIDGNGDVAVAGVFEGEVSFNESISLSVMRYGLDSYVAKYNSDGKVIWAKSYAAINEVRIKDLTFDKNNNMLIAGFFTPIKDVEEDDEPLTDEMFFFGMRTKKGNDGFVVKLTSSGELVWATQIKGDLSMSIKSVISTSSGAIFAVGDVKGSYDFSRDMVVFKVDEKGMITERRMLKGGSMIVNKAVCNDRGQLYVIGAFKETIKTVKKEYTSKGRSDIFIAKLKK